MVERMSRRALWMQKLSDGVVKGITERIRSGALAPGAPIGSRSAVAGEYVTSVAVVERALEGLLGKGLVEEGPGGILRVAAVLPPEHGFEVAATLGDSLDDVVEILQLRMGVETVAASLAATNPDPGALAPIEAAAAAFERAAETGEGAARADFLFHRAIAAAGGNRYILELLEYLGPLLIPRMRNVLPAPVPAGTDPNLERSVEEHRVIVDAIRAGAPDDARRAMEHHLTRTIALIRSLDAPT